jgi:hypothetical protein
MATKSLVTCACCDKPFMKENRYIKRSLKRGTQHYCSKSCRSRLINQKHPEIIILFQQNRNNTMDEFSSFRNSYHNILKTCKRKNRECTLTIQDLINQWNKQDGRCFFTKQRLLLPIGSSPKYRLSRSPYLASVDRIDSSIGYTPENIQWVSLIAQFAKNNFTNTQVIEFCQAVVAATPPAISLE